MSYQYLGELEEIMDKYPSELNSKYYQAARAIILASLKLVDYVIMFDEDTPYELIKFIKPDILVKGSDYKAENIVGYDIVTQKGGEVRTIDFVEGYSTTKIINKIGS